MAQSRFCLPQPTHTNSIYLGAQRRFKETVQDNIAPLPRRDVGYRSFCSVPRYCTVTLM